MTNDKSAEEIVRGLRISTPKCYPVNCDRCTGVIDSIDCDYFIAQKAADLIESQAAEIARLRAENESLAANGGKYMGIAEKRYEMYEEAIKRAEAAEIQLADEKVVSQSLRNAANGYKAQLAASQQRERAMLSDMAHEMECGACCHVRVDVCDEPCASCRRENSKFKWRGPQTAKEETKQ